MGAFITSYLCCDYVHAALFHRTDSFTRYSGKGGVRKLTGDGDEPVYSTLTTGETGDRSESIPLSFMQNESSQKLISESTDGRQHSSSLHRPPPLTADAYQIPTDSQEEQLSSLTPGSVRHFQATKRHASTSSGYNVTSHRVSPTQRTRPSVSPIDDCSNVVSASSPWNDYEHIDGDESFSPSSSFCESPTTPGNLPGRQKGSFKLRQSPRSPRPMDMGGVSASVPAGINPPHPPRQGHSVFAIMEDQDIAGHVTSVGGHVTAVSTGRMLQGAETHPPQHRREGSHSPKGSTGRSSPPTMKQALIAQFQSTDSMTHTQGRESDTSEAPPPYSSRPSSDAVLSAESSDPSTIDSGAYSRIDHQHRPWYQASNASLDSSGQLPTTKPPLSTKAVGERIQPYAVSPSELTKQKAGEVELKESIIRRSNNPKKSSFQTKQPVQPYTEPTVRSSVASLGHAQESPTFFEVVV